MEASTKIKALKNVFNKKPRKNSTGIISVWTGLEGEKTEPKLIGLNRFSIRFGSKTWKKIILVWLFILVQNWTGPKMLSPASRLAYLVYFPNHGSWTSDGKWINYKFRAFDNKTFLYYTIWKSFFQLWNSFL
jgi:hypothetical protein